MVSIPQAFVNPIYTYYPWPPYQVHMYPYYGFGYPAATAAPYSGHQRMDSMNAMASQDYGKEPLVMNIEQVTKQNDWYRTTLWTGEHFQVTLMSIPVGGDIGLEVHPTTDQFIRIEQGQGLVQMGDSKDNLDFSMNAYDEYAIMVPAGKWHNVTNTGHIPLKVYVIYAPPEHPPGTVHKTKAEAMAAHA